MSKWKNFVNRTLLRLERDTTVRMFIREDAAVLGCYRQVDIPVTKAVKMILKHLNITLDDSLRVLEKKDE